MRRSTPRATRRLLAVLEADSTDAEEFDEPVEELAKAVNHHLTEEELTILNPAREEVSEEVRDELGVKLRVRSATPGSRRAAGR